MTLPASAVYIVKHGRNMLYVGESGNLRERLAVHELRDFFECKGVTVSWIEVPPSVRKKTEAKLIKRLHPRLNGRASHTRRWILEEVKTGVPAEQAFRNSLTVEESNALDTLEVMVTGSKSKRPGKLVHCPHCGQDFRL
jgi:hypothetical protein